MVVRDKIDIVARILLRLNRWFDRTQVITDMRATGRRDARQNGFLVHILLALTPTRC